MFIFLAWMPEFTTWQESSQSLPPCRRVAPVTAAAAAEAVYDAAAAVVEAAAGQADAGADCHGQH